jgi:uridine kinase
MSKLTGFEIVGIAAPTCAGKTQLVTELLSRMPDSAIGLSMDEYDLYAEGSTAMDEELRDPHIKNWEDPALFDLQQFAIDLGQLSLGKTVRPLARSRESMAAGICEKIITPKKTNLVEGIFALHNPAARAVMDLTIFVDIPLDVMVERRLSTPRQGSTGNPWDDPDYIKGAMLEGTKRYVLPQRDYAQIVLDGLKPTQELADSLLGK